MNFVYNTSLWNSVATCCYISACTVKSLVSYGRVQNFSCRFAIVINHHHYYWATEIFSSTNKRAPIQRYISVSGES